MLSRAQRGALSCLSSLLAAVSITGVVHAQLVTIVQAGNQIPTGGWCDGSVQSLAAGSSRNYSLSGRIDGGSQSAITGKYRMTSQTDKFEWVSGEPAVNFAAYSASPTSFAIRAKAGAAAGTYAIDFVAVDAGGLASASKNCKITITAGSGGGGTTGVSDLATTSPGIKLEGSTTVLTSPPAEGIPSGNKVTILIKVANVGAVSSQGFRLSLNRFDHTCGGYPTAVGTITLDALAANAAKDTSFTDTNPPKPGQGNTQASVTVCYKTGISTATGGYYTDGNNNNHRAERVVKFYATSTTNDPVKFGDYLYGKFVHAKCVDCHSFTNNSSNKRSAHNNAGRTTTTTDVTQVASCSGCHNASPPQPCTGSPGCVANWHAAASSMNWSGKTAPQTCAQIKTGNFATAAAMKTHLKTDALILWAISKQNVSTTEWNSKVDAWVDGGMLCQ